MNRELCRFLMVKFFWKLFLTNHEECLWGVLTSTSLVFHQDGTLVTCVVCLLLENMTVTCQRVGGLPPWSATHETDSHHIKWQSEGRLWPRDLGKSATNLPKLVYWSIHVLVPDCVQSAVGCMYTRNTKHTEWITEIKPVNVLGLTSTYKYKQKHEYTIPLLSQNRGFSSNV